MNIIPDNKSRRLIEARCRELGLTCRQDGNILRLPNHDQLTNYARGVMSVQRVYQRKS